MQVSLLLTADYANQAENGKLNVMGIFTQIMAPQFPTVHPRMYLITQLNAGPAEYGRKFKVTIKLLDEDATQDVVNVEFDAEMPRGENGQRVTRNVILELITLVFNQPGTYQFSILVDGDEKMTLPLQVVQLTAQ